MHTRKKRDTRFGPLPLLLPMFTLMHSALDGRSWWDITKNTEIGERKGAHLIMICKGQDTGGVILQRLAAYG